MLGPFDIAKKVLSGHEPNREELITMAASLLSMRESPPWDETPVGLAGGSDFSEGKDITDHPSLYEERN